ncbi:MAG: cupin domain-containing protein [Candidatus Limnocylindrales bacterium]|jgi:quercetin dioxygenase-like cupin family protein
MEIRRFGIGHRRPDGPSGTHGVDGQSIHGDHRGAIAELAFRPNAAMAAHSNPNLTYFVVIEGGGFVQVGDERARVAAGEAVVWPPNVVHAAWTEQTPMRALVVEFTVEDPGLLMLEGGAVELPVEPAERSNAERSNAERKPADGGLVHEPGGRPGDRESPEREPW